MDRPAASQHRPALNPVANGQPAMTTAATHFWDTNTDLKDGKEAQTETERPHLLIVETLKLGLPIRLVLQAGQKCRSAADQL